MKINGKIMHLEVKYVRKTTSGLKVKWLEYDSIRNNASTRNCQEEWLQKIKNTNSHFIS